MANDLLRGRQVVLPLTNKSGGTRSEGDAVIISSGTAASFTTTTTANLEDDIVGVVIDTSIAADAVGRVCFGGYVPKINLSGSASLGDYVFTHTVAGQAKRSGTKAAGAFGQVLGTGTTPAAILGCFPLQTASGGGGGGDSTLTAAYASRAAAANDGNLFFPSDGFFLERDTGAAFVPWGPIYPLAGIGNAPTTWVNQGGASVSTTKGGIYLSAPALAGQNLRIRKKIAPATPYAITIAFIPTLYPANNAEVGLLFRQSSDGKLHAIKFMVDTSNTGGLSMFVTRYTNETTISSNDITTSAITVSRNPMFFQIADDGTNHTFGFSNDGQNFITLFSVARTTFITADEVGFYASSSNAVGIAAMTLLSWLET